MADGLRAALPLAGRSLLEYQAGLALAAGARHIVVLVERVPAALAQAVDRLRRQGARIAVARGLSDAIDRFEDDERILLIADGAVAAQGAVEALGTTEGAALLSLPDIQDYAMFERIDAAERWAGFALLDKRMLVATAAMLGDWDLTSTLLRRLVQDDAERIEALDPLGSGPVPPPILVSSPAGVARIEASLLRRAEPGEGNWAEHHLHRLVASPLIRPLIAKQVDQRQVAWAAVGLTLLAGLAAAFAFFWVSALLLPLAATIASAGRRMARIWGGAGPASWPELARRFVMLAILLLLAQRLAADGGWGWWMVAAMPPLALAGMAGLTPIVDALGAAPPPRWLASADALIWVAPLLAVVGGWNWMLVALACYAGASFSERFRAAWKEARDGGI